MFYSIMFHNDMIIKRERVRLGNYLLLSFIGLFDMLALEHGHDNQRTRTHIPAT